MRLLLGTFVPPLLVVLLVVMTPLGTGDGVHQVDLLHPLVPHVHLINGRVITHQAVATDASADGQNGQNGQHAGPAIGGGAGSAAASVGLGLSPTVPGPPQAALVGQLFFGRMAYELSIPTGRVEAPPDPPPTSAA
jgi:hypothetical protein